MRHLITVTALGVLLASGCGGDGDLKVKLDKIDSDNYCEKIAELLCHNMFLCCTGAKIEKSLGLTITTNESRCRTDVRLICEQNNYQLLYALNKGTVTLDATQAQTCLNTYLLPEEGVCFDFKAKVPWKDACEKEHFMGQQGAGAACLATVECKKDHVCGTDKKCKALPKNREPCTGKCAEGYFCNPQDQMCSALKKAGEKCMGLMECVKKHFCKPDPAGGDGKCAPLAKAGASCTGNSECESSTCIPGSCNDGSGKTCYKDDDCSGSCESGTPATCTKDTDCQGKCSVALTDCMSPYDCPSGETCDQKCKQSCQGKPTCGENYAMVDYCGGVLGLISTVPTP